MKKWDTLTEWFDEQFIEFIVFDSKEINKLYDEMILAIKLGYKELEKRKSKLLYKGKVVYNETKEK